MENNQDYKDMVKALAKDGQVIIDELTPEKAHQWHMATGVVGEAGELIDAVKKGAIYNKELDITNIIEELGDLEFYMEGLRDSLGITREETLVANVNKLGKRYAKGTYSNDQAQARADKEEGLWKVGDLLICNTTGTLRRINSVHVGYYTWKYDHSDELFDSRNSTDPELSNFTLFTK